MPTHVRGLAATVAVAAVLPLTTAPAHAVPTPTSAARSASTFAGTAPAPPATPKLTWTRCGPMQCATLDVPLNYARPQDGTITLSVSRRPADRQEGKLGVVFTNPGGPGAPGTMSVPLFASVLGRTVRQKFDIVAVDPRGTGGSDLAVCEGRAGEKVPERKAPVFPTTPEEVAAQLVFDRFVRDVCARNDPRILRHITTANSARDMDRVRAALGQAKINYYGVSYGSMLGSTYAAMFPRRVRTVTVDGVLDPVAWTSGRGNTGATTPMTTRINSHVATYETLMSAIAECERNGPSFCEEDETIRADWAELTESLRAEPLDLGGGVVITYDLVVALVAGSLYDPEGIPDALQFIHLLAEWTRNPPTAATPPAVRTAARARLKRTHDKVVARDEANRRNRIAYDPPAPDAQEFPPAFYLGFEATVCNDAKQPKDPQAWVRAARSADAVAPGFGSMWTWSSSLCAGWPFTGTSAYRGPFDVKPANGMLIMSTVHDPATNYTGAKALRRLSPGSRLVTVDGWGHATLDVSGCASWLRTKYLTTGALPARDTTCAPDHPLFTSLD